MLAFSPPPNIAPENLPISSAIGLQADVLRLDKIHPVISGNKWYKLRFYLSEAIAAKATRIVTFGGPWSNHIVATAALCRLSGIPCTGIIRGEEPANWSHTLRQARELGMTFEFISRAAYKEKETSVALAHANVYLIPEGGFGQLGATGAATMIENIAGDYTHIMCAVGTGTTMAGLINASNDVCNVIGIPVIRGDGDLHANISSLVSPGSSNWKLLPGFEFGGYAKKTDALLSFMNSWFDKYQIPSDFVYTAKLFYAFNTLLHTDFFPVDSRILLIHSGGLQGNASLPNGTLIF